MKKIITLGLFVFYLTDFTIYESLLLGSIVSSTDAAAVFSILRSKSLALKTKGNVTRLSRKRLRWHLALELLPQTLGVVPRHTG